MHCRYVEFGSAAGAGAEAEAQGGEGLREEETPCEVTDPFGP